MFRHIGRIFSPARFETNSTLPNPCDFGQSLFRYHLPLHFKHAIAATQAGHWSQAIALI